MRFDLLSTWRSVLLGCMAWSLRFAMAAGISGTVTGPDVNTPLSGIEVEAYQWHNEWAYWEFVDSAFTSIDGTYTLADLASGAYRIQFRDWSGAFAREVFDDAGNLDSGSDIHVGEETVTGIDATLAPASKIIGRVTGPDGSTPLEGIEIALYGWNAAWEYWEWHDGTSTDSNGDYILGGLRPGTYRIQFRDWPDENHVSEYYDDVQDLYSATDIVVPEETTVTGIDASLALAAKISGTVTGPDGSSPLSSVEVTAYQWNDQWFYWEWLTSAWTDIQGQYTLGGLPGGIYRLQFRDSSGDHVGEYYDDRPDLESAMTIHLPSETNLAGMDASLAAAAKISGKVTGPDGSTPLSGIELGAYRWEYSLEEWRWTQYATTDDFGDYTLGGLRGGIYRIRFYDPQNTHAPEFHSNAPDLESATDIALPPYALVTGIDASLSLGSEIDGTVTGPGASPLENAQVTLYRWNAAGATWDWQDIRNTDTDGTYRFSGLPSGTYRAIFRGEYGENFAPQAYQNATWIEDGTDINVPAAGTVSGIDAQLAPGSSVSGTVTGPDATPLEGIGVSVYRSKGAGLWEWVGGENTDASGNYVIESLAPAAYRVEFYDWTGGYAPAYHPNADSLSSATDVMVAANTQVTGIDASLGVAASISGQLTEETTSLPLPGLGVAAYRWDAVSGKWEWMGWGNTDLNGNYTIGGLAAGTYRVRFAVESSYYQPQVHAQALDLDDGSDIPVPLGGAVTGIDAGLAVRPPPPAPEIMGLKKAGDHLWELLFAGTYGQPVFVKDSGELSSGWNEGTPWVVLEGTNAVPRASSQSSLFWKLEMAP